MVYKIFEKKAGSKTSANEELAQELTNQIKKFQKRKVYASLKIIFWQQIQLKWDFICFFNCGVKYLIDVFIKHAWVKTLKDKKSKTVLYGFIEIANECKPKPNKLCVGQER